MTHEKAVSQLIDLASGHLHPDLVPQVQAHVSVCQDCHDWLETYRALEMAVERADTNDAGHVSAETLARFALVPDYLTKEIKDSVNSHLGQCDQCAVEADLCRSAVATSKNTAIHEVFQLERLEASPFQKIDAAESGSEPIAVRPFPQSSSWRGWKPKSVWTLLAASVVLGFALSTALFWLLPQSLSPETYSLTRTTLKGVTTIEASEIIEASSSLVDASANVTFRAKTVVLGDGFSVGNGASFTIESISGPRTN